MVIDPPKKEEHEECQPKPEPYIDYYQQWPSTPNYPYVQDQVLYPSYWNTQENITGWNNPGNYGNNQVYENQFGWQQASNNPNGWNSYPNNWEGLAPSGKIGDTSSIHETSEMETSSSTTSEWNQTSATIIDVQSNTDYINQTSDLGSSINTTNETNMSLDDLLEITKNTTDIMDKKENRTKIVSPLKEHPEQMENSQTRSVILDETDFIASPEIKNTPQGKVAQALKKDDPKLAKKSKKIKSKKSVKNWIPDTTLPSGWKKKSYEWKNKLGQTNSRYKYMSPINQKFESVKDVIKFMKNSGNYLEEDIKNLIYEKKAGSKKKEINQKKACSKNKERTQNGLPKETKNTKLKINSKRSNSNGQYNNFCIDETLPSGWKKKELKYGKFKICHFLSPENILYKTRKAVINCIQSTTNYSNEDLQKFQSSKKSKNYEEWFSNDDVLPSGWSMRKQKQTIDKDGKRKNLKAQYMNSTGQIFKTKRSAIFHMKMLGTYSDSDVHKFRQNIKKQHQKKIEKQHLRPIKKQLQKKKTAKISSKKNSNYSEWITDDEMLPIGWKKRSYETKLTGDTKSFKYQYFCGNTNRIFKCTEAVLYFMKESRIYSPNDRKKFIAGKKKQK